MHVRDLGLTKATDEEIFRLAMEEERILIALDTDFGTILATYEQQKPSLLLFRSRLKSTEAIFSILMDNLSLIQNELESGAIVVIEDYRIRVRRLPIIES
ncbi:MAG: DUF5615 family PIN-like protein [Planctomycetota bacterium]